MLSPAYQAYCRALVAVERREYAAAVDEFDQAADEYREDREFRLLWETTRLLLAVKEERSRIAAGSDRETQEVTTDGQEDKLRR